MRIFLNFVKYAAQNISNIKKIFPENVYTSAFRLTNIRNTFAHQK